MRTIKLTQPTNVFPTVIWREREMYRSRDPYELQFYQPEVNYRYGDFQQALPKAQSYAEAIGALPYPL